MESSQAIIGLRRWLPSTSTLEVLLVAAGRKPAARVRVLRETLPALSRDLKQLGLRYSVGFEELRPFSNDSSLAREWVSFGGRRYMSGLESYVYVALDKALSETVRHADERCDILETGSLLGYPLCCTHMFNELARHRKIASNAAFFVYENGMTASWLMNVCLLDMDCTLITHVPCSPHCTSSLNLAKHAFETLYEADPSRARSYSSRLGGFVLYGQDGSFVSFGTELDNQGRRIASKVVEQSKGHVLPADQIEGRALNVNPTDLQIGTITLLSDQFRVYEFV